MIPLCGSATVRTYFCLHSERKWNTSADNDWYLVIQTCSQSGVFMCIVVLVLEIEVQMPMTIPRITQVMANHSRC